MEKVLQVALDNWSIIMQSALLSNGPHKNHYFMRKANILKYSRCY